MHFYLKSAIRIGILLALLPLSLPCLAQAQPLYLIPSAPLEARVNDLYRRLTETEKLTLLSGTQFTTNAIPRLGIPAMAMDDGAQGVRGGMPSTLGPATCFPASVTMASTWDPALVAKMAHAIAEEALNKGTGAQVLLGPAVNIQRSPLGGRDGEYFSEDPFLTGQMAAAYIQGVQSTGCAACIKHFVCNNEEVDRNYVNVHVGQRALHEIYLPAFEAGIKQGHVWTLMASYNMINGYYATENKSLLTDVLRKEWGFDGLVMSDWGAVHQTAGTVNAGTDLEMPGPGDLDPAKLETDLENGKITQAEVDAHVKNILRTMIRVGLLNGPRKLNPALVNSQAHQHLAFDGAAEGIVLLKDTHHVLPFNRHQMHSLAIIGPAAQGMQFGAQGSVSVQPSVSAEPLAGITSYAGTGIKINYAAGQDTGVPIPSSAFGASGLVGSYYDNLNLTGAPVLTRRDPQIQFSWNTVSPAAMVPRTDFSVQWSGTLLAPMTGEYTFLLTADDGCRLFLNGKELINHWVASDGPTETVRVPLTAGERYHLQADYFQALGNAYIRLNWLLPGSTPYQDAVDAAAHSDAAVVCVGTLGTEGEGQDRATMQLPDGQEALIAAVAAVNPRTIVILNNGGPVLMASWLPKVAGLLESWFPGEEGGNALGAILFGKIDPSGKLPTTLAVRRQDYPDYGNFPGINGQVYYKEGIYVGYRAFDKRHIAPLFPFGYGLSYTNFRFSHARVSDALLNPHSAVTVGLDVTNTGSRAGAEVAELYTHDPHPKIDKPIRELKGFQKVFLKPGETKRLDFTVTPRDLAYCDTAGRQWKADPGVYDVEMGDSSRNILCSVPVRLTAVFRKPIIDMAATARVPGDLAYDHPAAASSVQMPGLGPENAFDDNWQTRWSSAFSDPQWISVDLGHPVVINRVFLEWEAAYASHFSLQVSQDDVHWTTVYSTASGIGGAERITFPAHPARWVRMEGTQRGTQFGYSLYSFEVFGPSGFLSHRQESDAVTGNRHVRKL